MPFPPSGSSSGGGTGVYQTRPLNEVIDSFNMTLGAGNGQINFRPMIAWMSVAIRIARNNGGNISVLEIPGNAGQGRPPIILFGDFSNAGHRARAELIDDFLSSNHPDILAILAPFTQTVTVGNGQTVNPQAIYVALAAFNYSIPGQPGNNVKGMGDFFSRGDSEFEVLLNTMDPVNTPVERAQFLYYLIHELDHRNGTHASLDLSRTRRLDTIDQFNAFFQTWTPGSILGATGGGTGAGYRLTDPHYTRAFGQWDRALAALSINLSASERQGIINNGDQGYNQAQVHHMRQSMWEVFVAQRALVGQPGYYLDQVISRMEAAGAIRRKKGANPQSTDPNDFEQVPAIATEEARQRRQAERQERARQRALERMEKQLRKYYESQNMDPAEIQRRLDQIAQMMINMPGDTSEDEQRMALFADYEAALEDEAYLMSLERQAGYGAALGSTLGAIIGGNNVAARVVSSAFFETLGTNLFELIINKGPIVTLPSGGEVSVFDDFGADFIANLKKAGIGAVSSFLTAKLVEALGVDGFAGEALETGAGVVIGDILANIAAQVPNPFEGIASAASLATAAASFLGTRLAQEIYNFETVGGQIGSALGSALFAYDAGLFLAAAGVTPVTFVIAVVWVAIGALLGGLIGSIFGGTPRSGADAQWNERLQRFAVANIYARKGGSKSAAASLAGAAADTFNAVLDATGGTLLDPRSVQSGNYGMRGSKYVYRPISTQDKGAITQSFSGEDGAEKLLRFGIYAGLSNGFDLAGGDVYAKRGLTGNIALTAHWENFDFSKTLADVRTAIEYGRYLADKDMINLLMAAQPGSAFSLGWLATIARAEELGVTRRSSSDWNGGFSFFLGKLFGMNAANIELALLPTMPGKLERTIGFFDAEDVQLGLAGDTIDTSRTTTITATSGNDVITLNHHAKAIVRGGDLVDSNGWPSVGRDQTGENLIALGGWPPDPLNLPSGGASVAGWQNPAAHLDETQWIAGAGPDNSESVLMRAGQLDASAEGGGNLTNAAAIDPAKGYEYSYYFQLTEIGRHALYFGLGGAAVQNLATGAADTNPYFVTIDVSEQLALQAAGKLEIGKWYKVTGYVLPGDASPVAAAGLGGVYDMETGNKIADNEANFRWAPSVPATGATAYSRFFNYYGEASPGWSANFYQPGMRQIDSSAYVPEGFALPQGWQDLWGVSDETRWARTAGPNGRPVIAVQAGQSDVTAEGGGGHTNEVLIDGQKAYEFTFWFKKSDLGKHSLYFGLDYSASAYVENAATGADIDNPYFVTMDAATQQALLEEDRWYKVVGYVLPEGAGLPPAGSLGGVFDTVTGAKVASATTFRWNAGRPDSRIHARFFDFYDHDQPSGFTTYFHRPEIREVDEQVVVGGADRLGSTAGLTINGMAGDGHGLSVPVAATIDAGAGDDVVHAGDMGNNVLGGAGNDAIYGGRLDDWLFGDDGDDVLNAGAANAGALGGDGNYLNGGAGNDLLIGREGSDWLEGGTGTDTLEGGRGDDILAGGAGKNDILRGGLGNDQYLFRIGDADGSTLEGDADIVREASGYTVASVAERASVRSIVTGGVLDEALFRFYGFADWQGTSGGSIATQNGPGGQVQAGGDDTLVLGIGVSIGDIAITKGSDPANLVVTITKTNEKIVLEDWFNGFNKIENLAFADGQVLRIADFDTFTLGTDGSDYIYATNLNDFVHAGNGNDVVFLLLGNDFGNGGAGNDFVSGDGGNDIVIGLDGDDIVQGGTENDSVTGGAGDDEVRGGTGNDVVAGGAGFDFVVGGAGNDIFKFSRGDGTDVVVDELDASLWEDVWINGTGFVNGYTIGTGEDSSKIFQGSTLIFDGTDWFARVDYDSITGKLRRHNPGGVATIAANAGTDTIEFSLGIDVADVQLALSGNDLVIGVEASGGTTGGFAAVTDRLVLREWAIASGGGRGAIEKLAFFGTGTLNISSMTLKGGTDGADTISVTAGDTAAQWMTGGIGDDAITGGSKNDLLTGNGGHDLLKGAAGADVLLGGAGNDILDGGAGGSFVDGVDALGNGTGGTARGDILVGGAGLDIASYMTASAGVTASLAAPTLNTGDAALDDYLEIEGLSGTGFADTLRGDDGDNELRGNGGADTLSGGLGNDTYVFGRTDGLDIVADEFQPIEDVVVDAAGELGNSFSERFDLVQRTGGSFEFVHVIEHSETGEVVYRRAFTSSSASPAMPARLQDGWIASEDRPWAFSGNQVSRTSSNAAAAGGDDVLYLDDYTGRIDRTGSGIQTIGLSSLSFAFDTAAGKTSNLIVTVTASDKVTLKNFRKDAAADPARRFDTERGIETLIVSSGEQASLKGLRFDANGNFVLTGTSGDDFLVDMSTLGNSVSGGAGDDVLSGRDGDDLLDGGEGDDLLGGGAGSDQHVGGAGTDTATYFGGSTGVNVNLATNVATLGDAAGDTFSGVENVTGTDYGDVLIGDVNDNVLRGFAGNDQVDAGDGNDVIDGGAGTDTIRGGMGDDAIEGGEGNDNTTATINGISSQGLTGGEDNDIISGGDGNDVLIGDTGTAVNGGATYVSIYNRVANSGFEDLGTPSDDTTQGANTRSGDLPGWTTAPGGAFFVAGAAGARRLTLDTGSANVEVSQTVTGIGAGQALRLTFNADLGGGATAGLEVYWNGEKLTFGEPSGGTYTFDLVGSQTGSNRLRFVGSGAADGVGATIDSVALVTIGGGADTLVGGAGNDTLYGNDGNDKLIGGADNDTLQGGNGNDNLAGGTGTDTLNGGAGNDVYNIFGDGGADTITVGGGHDSIVFGTTVEGGETKLDPGQIRLTRSGAALIITVLGASSVVTVNNWFSSSTATTPSTSGAARRIVVGDFAIAQSDVQAFFLEQARIGSGAPDTAYDAVFEAVWQPLASYTDRFVLNGTSSGDTLVPDPAILGGVTINGLGGNDRITGTAYADIITGGAGSDVIDARAGDDEIRFGIESGTFDTVAGGEGKDRLVADVDNATIALGRTGSIDPNALSGVEEIDGNGKTNVQVRLSSGSTLDLSTVVVSGISRIVGATGNETITGSAGDDVIDGGTGNDILSGGDGDDQLIGGGGIDSLNGGLGRDTADFAAVTGALNVDLAAQTVSGATVTIASIENVIGGTAGDTLSGGAGSNVITGGGGNDVIDGRGGDDVLSGGDGADILRGGTGDDVLTGGAGVDSFDGGDGIDIADYSDRSAALTLSMTGSAIDGGTETYVDIEGLTGGSGNDTITGGAGADRLAGGGGNDSLVGGLGNDRLEGGGGNDSFTGGDGNDTIVLRGNRAGYTVDTVNRTITDTDLSDGDDGTDSYAADIEFVAFADQQLMVGIPPNNPPQLGSPGLASGSYADNAAFTYTIPTTAFVDEDGNPADPYDGLSFTAALAGGGALPSWLGFDSVTKTFSYQSGAAAIGASVTIRVTASDGEASIHADFTISIVQGAGASINGGAGDDLLVATFRAEAIDGGGGNDTADYGSSTFGVTVGLTGAAGAGGHGAGDTLANIENLWGSVHADTLTGSAIANTLDGGAGDDTILAGDGDDLLGGDAGTDTLRGEGGNDNLAGGAGADLLDGGAGTDTADYYWLSRGRTFVANSSGVTVDLANMAGNLGIAAGDTFVSIENVSGTQAADTLRGDGAANELIGREGADALHGAGGSDVLRGQQGADSLFGDAGDDQLYGGDEDDILAGGADNDLLHGELGNDTLYGEAGTDTLVGGDGDDWLSGGAGADSLQGGAGNNWAYYYWLGYGVADTAGVTVNLANAGLNTGAAAGDTYTAITRIYGTQVNDDLTGDAADNVILAETGADTVRGGDGNDAVQGMSGADTLYGDGGADTLEGGADNDALFGGDGNDTLLGGDGDDSLTGGLGADIVNGDGGNDTVHALAVGEDVIDGGAGTDTVSYQAASSGVTVNLTSAAHKLTSIEAVVGTNQADIITGSGADNQLSGGLGADTLDGGGGDDRLDGGDGDDLLVGGSGADALVGGLGVDTVSYATAQADAAPINSAAVGSSSVNGTEVVAARVISLNGVRVDLVANMSTSATALIGATAAQGSDAAGDWFHGVEHLVGSAFNDRLVGTNNSSNVAGGSGDDIIYGGAGNDNLSGGDGDDVIYGEAGVDTLDGGAGQDRLFGGGEQDTLIGGAGNDLLDAGDAGDVLVGGDGDDILIGGNGADTYQLGRAGGADTIYNYDDDSARDAIDFVESITYRELWFRKSGKDLVVNVLGGTGQATVKDWFANITAGDWSAADNFYVDVIIAGTRYNDTLVNLPDLLAIMNQYGSPPAGFGALSAAHQAAIDTAWGQNQAPTIVAAAGNPGAVDEAQTSGVFHDFTFTVGDDITPLANLVVTATATGGIFPATIAAGDILGSGATRTVRLRPAQFASGTTSLTVTVSEAGGALSTSLTIPNLVVNAVASGITLGAPASVAGNAGTAISLAGISATLLDTNSETLDYLYLDAIPAGVVIASGANSFTAPGPNSSVNILGWNLAGLTVTAPAGSSADFALQLRSRSREGTSVSGETTRSISVGINGAPTAITFTPQAFNENVVGIAVGGTVVGTLSATDPDGAGAFTYVIVGGAQASKFRIEGSTLYLAAGQSLDFEDGDALVNIRVSDAGGMQFTRNGIVVRPTNVEELPTTPTSGGAVTFDENATGDTGVRFASTDDDGDAISFVFANGTTIFGNFTIQNGNQLWVSSGLDYETASIHDLAIHARANGLNSANALTQRVNVGPKPEGPTTPTTTNANVTFSENQTGDTGVRFNAIDPEGDAITYYFSATGTQTYGNFQIIGNALHVVTALNYESPPANLTFGVYAASPGFTSGAVSQTVTIGPLDEAPNVPSPIGPYSINENATFAAVLSGSVDPENVDVDYSFVTPGGVSGNPGLLFEILNDNTNNATLRIAGNGTIDFEWLRNQSFYTAIDANSGYVTVKVVATDVDVTNPNTNFADARKSPVRDIRINVANLNDNAPGAPAIASWGTTTFAENTGAGTVVATLTASDPDGSLNGLAYQLTSNPGGMFEIVGNQIRVVSSAHFNYEAFASGGASVLLGVGVRTTDGTHVSGSYTFNVQVNNADDLLPAAGGIVMQNGYSSTILEGTVTPLQGLVVARALASDGDGDAITYSIVGGNPGNTFSIDASGYISALAGVNYEAMGGASTLAVDAPLTVNLVVRAAQSNNSGRYVDQVLTLTITDAAEFSYIYDGSGSLPAVGSTFTGFAAGYGYSGGFSGGLSNLVHWRRVWRDANNNGVLGDVVGGVSDFSLAGYNDNVNPQYWVNAGYRWAGSAFASAFLQELPPVVFDLDGDGRIVSGRHADFDVDGDGVADQVGWIGAGDAFLALDRDGNGAIDRGAEISFMSDLPGANTDLEGLKAFDTNGDGSLDASDARFDEFRLWQDVDGDGVSQAGELRSLAEAGIVSLSLTSNAPRHASGDEENVSVLGITSYTRADGTSAIAGDVALRWQYGVIDTSRLTTEADNDDLPALSLAELEFARNAGKYRFESRSGSLFVTYRKAGVVDPRVGMAEAATIFSFRNRREGMLAPIVLDLAGDGIRLTSRGNSKARFDMDSDGIADKTGWIGKGQGILVIDRNGDGLITDGGEISFVEEKPDAKSGLEALAALDADRDGVIDSADARFGELKVWVDRNRNGFSDAGELKTLEELGIDEIGVLGRPVDQLARVGRNLVLSTATFGRADGTTGTLADVALAFRPSVPRPSDALASMRAALAASFDETRGPAEILDHFVEDERRAIRMSQTIASFGAAGAIDSSGRLRDPQAPLDWAAAAVV
jgi:Ca2+-binding RTX toxin-like protein